MKFEFELYKGKAICFLDDEAFRQVDDALTLLFGLAYTSQHFADKGYENITTRDGVLVFLRAYDREEFLKEQP
jgi:hypothetical protein